VTARTARAMSVRRARRLAREIVTHHFGTKPARLLHKASGLTNFVFEVSHAQGDFIVRVSDEPAKLNAYQKEQWASGRAREAGVPTAEILEVGNEVVPFPYMISLKVRGDEATHHPKRLEIARELGALAKRIHGIRTQGYGRTFDWSSNTLSKRETWRDYLANELRARERIAVLERWKMLPPPALRRLRAAVRRMERWDVRPALTHSDLRLKNVIVDEAGRIGAVIDWENCESNLAPHWDLALALHDLGIDAKEAFVEGYGLRAKELLEMAPAIRAINLLGYAPAVEAMAASKDKAGLERSRARLGGVLDLYAI
jgi:aminoglycoside phosphotransferase (APT) family kinase protein